MEEPVTHSRVVYSQHAYVQLKLCELQNRTLFALQAFIQSTSQKCRSFMCEIKDLVNLSKNGVAWVKSTAP